MDGTLSDALCAFAAPLRQVNINKSLQRTKLFLNWFVQKCVLIVLKWRHTHTPHTQNNQNEETDGLKIIRQSMLHLTLLHNQ